MSPILLSLFRWGHQSLVQRGRLMVVEVTHCGKGNLASFHQVGVETQLSTARVTLRERTPTLNFLRVKLIPAATTSSVCRMELAVVLRLGFAEHRLARFGRR